MEEEKSDLTEEQENNEEPVSEETSQDLYVTNGSAVSDNSLDRQLIQEWDPENPLMMDEDASLEEVVESLENAQLEMQSEIHADDYRRISPEEFDEFDSLMDENAESVSDSNPQNKKTELTAKQEEEVDEMERLFVEDEQLSASDDLLNQPAVTLEELEEDMEADLANQDELPQEDEMTLEDKTPSFEDRGMSAGFFVTEEDIEPTYEELQEEFEAKEGIAPPEKTDPLIQGQTREDTFPADLFYPPGPTIETHPAPEIVGDLPADSQIVETAVTDTRVRKLMQRTEVARRRVNDEIDSIELAREMLELIRSATTLLMSTKANYEEAERSLNEVEYRLSYSRRVKVWSEAISYRLLTYEVFWLLVFGLSALFVPSLLSALIGQLNSVSPDSLPDFILMDDLFLGISTAIWGGLGGVVGAMYSLWRHVSLKQDFNPQHKMWYYTQPIMGIPIGIVVFLLVRIGIGYTIDGVLDFASPYGIYMMAWIAGFQQNILYEIIRQILRLFRIQN